MTQHQKNKQPGTSLVAQWLRLHTSTTGGMGSIPGQGTKISHATQPKKKERKKEKEQANRNPNNPI